MADEMNSGEAPPAGARGMGRGLAAILPKGRPGVEGLRDLAVDTVVPNPSQPRREFDGESLMALSESIRARGVLQPIVVTARAGGAFELIAGERRLRAARMAGLETIPAIVREAEDRDRLELALIENVAREDLNAVDEARACSTIVEDLGLTKEELGRRIGRSRVAVSNLIRLLDLPDEVLALIEAGELSGAHGRAILMSKDAGERKRLAREAARQGWSVRETERQAKRASDGARGGGGRTVVIHPDLADALGAASDALTAALGREVTVRPRPDGYRAEFELESPREGVDLAERILRQLAA